MIEIVEVKTKKHVRDFTMFPLKLYKNCPYYVPPFISDEMILFNRKKNANLIDNEIVGYLAYKNKKVVGRIAGILQNKDNEITGKHRVRISRVDFIDDYDVSNALFSSVEEWAKSKGMDEIHGPLGFNDLEREGLLIRGFDELSDFEENYSYEYYPKHFEKLGYGKSVDWNEYSISIPNTINPRTTALAQKVKERYNIKTIESKHKNKVIDKYKNQIFELIDECYGSLYGVVPLNERLKNQFVSQFKLLVTMDYLTLVVDENDKLIGFGLVFPSLAKAMQKTKGRILSVHIFSLLKALKKNDTIDLALVAVKPSWQTKGVAAVIMERNIRNFIKNNIKYAETNLQLENNNQIHALFSGFEMRHHKDRRCYIKSLK